MNKIKLNRKILFCYVAYLFATTPTIAGNVFDSLEYSKNPVTAEANNNDKEKQIDCAGLKARAYRRLTSVRDERRSTYDTNTSQVSDCKKSINELNQALMLCPNDAEAYLFRADVFFELKNYISAISDLCQVIRLNPNDASAFEKRGDAHMELKDYKAAIDDYSESIVINPYQTMGFAYDSRAKAQIELGNYQAAIEDFKKMIQLNPTYSYAYVSRADAYLQIKDYTNALNDYGMAIKIAPDETAFYKKRSAALILAGDEKSGFLELSQIFKHLKSDSYEASVVKRRARELGIAESLEHDDEPPKDSLDRFFHEQRKLENFAKALNISPDSAEKFVHRGDARYVIRDEKGAFDDYHSAISLDAKFGEAYRRLGNICFAQRKYREAIENLSKSLALNSDDAESYKKRGDAYSYLNDSKAAIEDYSRALRINPQDASTLRKRARCYDYLVDSKKIFKDLDDSIHADPNESDSYDARASQYLLQGDLKSALRDYSAAIRLCSVDDWRKSGLYRSRAKVQFDLKDYKSSIADYSKALTEAKAQASGPLQPFEIEENSEALSGRARARSKSQDFAGAIKDFNSAIAITPQDKEHYKQLAMVCIENKDYKGAIDALTRSLKVDANDASSFIERGLILARLHHWNESFSDLNRASKCSSLDSLMYLGATEFLLENYEKATNHFEKFALSTKSSKDECKKIVENCTKSLQTNAADLEALNQRGSALLESGNFVSAVEDYDRVLRLKPNDLEAFAGRTFAYMGQKKYQQVISDCTQKLLKPRANKAEHDLDAIYLMFRAANYSKVGKKNKATADYCAARRLSLNGGASSTTDFDWYAKVLTSEAPAWYRQKARTIL